MDSEQAKQEELPDMPQDRKYTNEEKDQAITDMEKALEEHRGTPERQMNQLANVIMKYFDYEHLPPHLQQHSRPFADLAQILEATLPNGPEKSTALRKLLESKDAAVRAALDLY